ncbi:MAG TPA: hypothetical protein VK158_01855 [Acidobacteriota bacterium]|nr:hypothetical protein [Acidobacteriota bacterium]
MTKKTEYMHNGVEPFIHAQVVGYEKRDKTYVLGLDDGKFLSLAKLQQSEVDGLVGKVLRLSQESVEADETDPDLYHTSYAKVAQSVMISIEKID